MPLSIAIHTLSMEGISTLGPLDENEATFGEYTVLPITVVVAVIFATGFLIIFRGKIDRLRLI